ncbi:inositol monophosphatase family protein [Tenggerimyces flavus]|uniref:Inositol monophosphatase family protein n=1 Tax=Tenggerimyces flavus TaxID=1708749 RepID=A0ABV7YA08_9ACTN|nr:inositol monophosphatase family protein [Tenggerimyces flavus]MBM7783562.1 myo-inositol-1(or 4)-monophosphatase [Tenggerimyces flavus]
MTIATAELLPIAMRAIDIARRTLREQAPNALTQKGDRDFASNLDYAIEREMRDFLQAETPKIGFLGEEEGAANLDPDRPYWALDPVDGTANLVHGLPLCGSSLGLIHHKQPILGVVDLPFLNERYYATQHGGAELNGRQIHGSTTTELRGAIIAIGDYAVGARAAQKNAQRHALTHQLADRVERIRMFGSAAIDLVWAAAGRIDGTVLLSNKPWDTAAGAIIAREAGLQVVDLDGKDHDASSRATISATPAILDDLLDVVSAAAVDLGK